MPSLTIRGNASQLAATKVTIARHSSTAPRMASTEPAEKPEWVAASAAMRFLLGADPAPLTPAGKIATQMSRVAEHS